MSEPVYPSKILLFGEYAVLRGAKALAVPFRQFSGQWRVGGVPEAESVASLQRLLAALEEKEQAGELSCTLDLAAFSRDLAAGLWFDSSIPTGYGAGSSGALTAGVFGRYYHGARLRMSQLKNILGEIESVFHGASSGFDPLVSYEGKPLMLQEGIATPANIQPTAFSFFLLDTGKSRSTAPWVELFLKKCTDETYDRRIENELVTLNDLAVEALISQGHSRLWGLFRAISQFEWDHFQEMIPDSVQGVWWTGLKGNPYVLKLCGAGGGGFLLGMTDDWPTTQQLLASQRVIPIPALHQENHAPWEG